MGDKSRDEVIGRVRRGALLVSAPELGGGKAFPAIGSHEGQGTAMLVEV